MDGRPRLRRIAAALAVTGAVSAAVAPAATAAALEVHVVNTRGVQQASLVAPTLAACGGYCGLMATDANGRTTLDALPGDSISVTRGGLAPEGAGVGYTVPDPVPAAPVTVTLPALPGTVAPGIDAAEGWLLDHVNAERGLLGRAPLTLSSTLSRAADAYAHYLSENGLFSHTALADPGTRAVDQGWPVPGGSSVGEALALAPSKEFALQGWQQSGGHWALLMMGGLDSVGVGQAGGRWIMMPGNCSLASAPERCGLGADPGVVPPGSRDPAAPPGSAPRGVPAPGAVASRRPALRVSLRKRGRRLVVRVRVLRGRGALRVEVRRGRREARLRHRHHGGLHRYVGKLPRRGRWTITVRFAGADGWADRRLPRRVVRVR
jgi:hypothetical protein